MTPAVLTAALAAVLLWAMYDELIDHMILGEYQSVLAPIMGLACFCEAVFHLMGGV